MKNVVIGIVAVVLCVLALSIYIYNNNLHYRDNLEKERLFMIDQSKQYNKFIKELHFIGNVFSGKSISKKLIGQYSYIGCNTSDGFYVFSNTDISIKQYHSEYYVTDHEKVYQNCEFINFDKIIFINEFKPNLLCGNIDVSDYAVEPVYSRVTYMTADYSGGVLMDEFQNDYDVIDTIDTLKIITNTDIYDANDCTINDNTNYWTNKLIHKPHMRLDYKF